MTPEELNNAFDRVIDDIQADGMGRIMVAIGESALVTIKERIIKSGTDADGQMYRPYSTKPMLSGCKNMLKGSCEKVVGSKEKRRDLKWVTLDKLDKSGKKIRLFTIPGGYRQFREINGRQSGFVDFSFSGRMWANIKIKSQNSEHNSGIVRIGATTKEDKDKLSGNTERRADILKLSKSELTDLSGLFGKQLEQIFHNHGL